MKQVAIVLTRPAGSKGAFEPALWYPAKPEATEYVRRCTNADPPGNRREYAIVILPRGPEL